MKRRNKGFTLVELLVVIGVIALLISILLPSLNSAREKAKAIACAANMRSITQAVAIYQAENKGAAVPIAMYVKGDGAGVDAKTGMNTQGTHWQGYLWSRLKMPANSNVRVCPTVRTQLTPNPLSPPNTDSWASYMYNTLIGGQDTTFGSMRPSAKFNLNYNGSTGNYWVANPYRNIPASSETAMFVEANMVWNVQSTYLNESDRGGLNSRLRVRNPITASVNGETHQIFINIAPVHNRKPSQATNGVLNGYPTAQGYINVAYCDGSVRSAFVRQGENGLTGNITNPFVTADNGVNNGISGSVQGQAIIPGTRYDPALAP